jgi:hypothetical protein
MPAAGVDIHGQPKNGLADQPIGGPIAVAVVDANGNTIVTNNTQLVTLSISSGPKGANLEGTTKVRAVHGIATFTDVWVSTAGTYVLEATGGKLTPDFSNPFTVSPSNVTHDLVIHYGSIHPVRKDPDGHRFTETIRITNQTNKALEGPLALVLMNLPAVVTLANSDGKYQSNPYINVLGDSGVLEPGKNAIITLDFVVTGLHPDPKDIHFDLEALLGI